MYVVVVVVGFEYLVLVEYLEPPLPPLLPLLLVLPSAEPARLKFRIPVEDLQLLPLLPFGFHPQLGVLAKLGAREQQHQRG